MTQKMHKNIGLLVGGLGLLLVSTASATTTPSAECGSVGNANIPGNIQFSSAVSEPGVGMATAPPTGGAGVITCFGFTVPAGQTLEYITVTVDDAADYALNDTSVLTQTWTYSGEPLSPQPAGSDSEVSLANGVPPDFSTCISNDNALNTGNLQCKAPYNFVTLNPYSNGQTTGSFSFTVTPSVNDGGGLFNSGFESADVFISFTYTSSVPEPASLLLIGGGLIGLGVFARRKRRS